MARTQAGYDLLLRVLGHAVQNEGMTGDEANRLLDPAFDAAMPVYVTCWCGYEKVQGTECGLPCV